MYFLIFGVTADQIAIPETIAYNILPAAKRVVTILSFAMPVIIVSLLFVALKITHKVVGPFDRIVREVDECARGEKKDHIKLRPTDKFWPLVNNINHLLDKKL
jgi:nitrogen fixation/metabolism regulation signal transduction histidine kinase